MPTYPVINLETKEKKILVGIKIGQKVVEELIQNLNGLEKLNLMGGMKS